jgi:hypothetical protein
MEVGISEELRIIGSDKDDTDYSLNGRLRLQQWKLLIRLGKAERSHRWYVGSIDISR